VSVTILAWSRRAAAVTAATSILAIIAFALLGSTSRAEATSPQVIHLSYIGDLTGLYAPLEGSATVAGAKAYLAYVNAHGGIKGAKVVLQVLDTQSTSAGGVSAARRAVASHPFAIVNGSNGWLASAWGILGAAKTVPIIGSSYSPGFLGKRNVFAVFGDVITHSTDAWVQPLLIGGHKNLALIGTSNGAPALQVVQHLLQTVDGGTTAIFDSAEQPVDDAATLLALAQRIVASGANGVLAFTGNPQALQVDLNGLNANIQVVGSGDPLPSYITQYGSTINGLVFALGPASPWSTQDPGVVQFSQVMVKYGGGQTYAHDVQAELGYAIMKTTLDAIQHSGAPYTSAKLMTYMSHLKNYTAGGLLPPMAFPKFQTSGSPCLGFSVVENGKWKSLIPGPSPFICGTLAAVG
jgi:branched-chain amino acid transport system substrate-binding protein